MPEIVLLDINMPKRNGFEILKIARSSEDFKEVPIIIIFSTSEAKNDIEKARELKANGFLSKPCHIADYIKLFQNI